MSSTRVTTNQLQKNVDVSFTSSHDKKGGGGTFLKVIISQREGLLLADQIRNATLAVWPVEVEKKSFYNSTTESVKEYINRLVTSGSIYEKIEK